MAVLQQASWRLPPVCAGVAVLLPQVPYRFSSLLMRIENPYTQWVWIANPNQRHFDISALEVANIYRNRWQIEVFFKWIKQNIVIKTLWGYSENAVKTHLWVDICAYLVVARIKATCDTPYSITEILSILHVSALEKTSLKELLSSSETLIQNHDVNEPNLFD